MRVMHWSSLFFRFWPRSAFHEHYTCIIVRIQSRNTRGLLILHGYSGKQFFRQVARARTKDKKSDASNS